MASADDESLGGKIARGLVITKHGQSSGNIKDFKIYETGHPLPDDNTIRSTEKAISMVKSLDADDIVLFF